MAKLAIIAASSGRLANHPLALFADSLRSEVEAAIGNKTAEQSMHVFSGWGARIDPTSYTINPDFWLPSAASKLRACPVYISGYFQSAGGTAITQRHGIMVDHFTGWGPPVGSVVRFSNYETGQTFETTIAHRQSSISTPDVTLDIIVVSYAEELPSWITPIPFLALSETQVETIRTADSSSIFYAPMVSLSQGNITGSNEPYSNTPNNFKLYLSPWSLYGPYGQGNIAEFRHITVGGDSGMPNFVLHNGDLHLMNCNSGQFYSTLAHSVINNTIAAADAATGFNTGYTVTVAPDPTL